MQPNSTGVDTGCAITNVRSTSIRSATSLEWKAISNAIALRAIVQKALARKYLRKILYYIQCTSCIPV